MIPVFNFNEYYTKSPCLISEGILETYDESNKVFALVRIFIDLSSENNQPYVIFIKKTKKMIILDLVSYPKTLEEIIEKHEKISVDHLILGVGSLKVKDKKIILKEGKNANLSAALLWTVDFESNLSPESGLVIVKNFLNPDC
jgi:hypothetical protein